MKDNILFTSHRLGKITLTSRIVMAPMTRSRATGNVPNELMAKYYEMRADAGLIITEGTSPSPNGLGYTRIPGIFSREQVEGWKKVTSAVKGRGGHIFVQLMHTGRVSHALNLPQGAQVLAPSAVQVKGQIWTDAQGQQPFPLPKAMTLEEISQAKQEYVEAAKNAILAGFDGVELHGANGYLLEQFLSPISNTRADEYGGSIVKRARFVLEVAAMVSEAIGNDRTAIRLSPYGVSNDMFHYPEIEQEYTYLAEQLNQMELVYIHLVDHSSMGAPQVPASIKQTFRAKFKNTLILSGGFSAERAKSVLEDGQGDLVAFGKPFINNPDLVQRFRSNWPLSQNLDMKTFYSPGEQGYIDYPVYQEVQ